MAGRGRLGFGFGTKAPRPRAQGASKQKTQTPNKQGPFEGPARQLMETVETARNDLAAEIERRGEVLPVTTRGL
jgi:hypothetical protein